MEKESKKEKEAKAVAKIKFSLHSKIARASKGI